MIHLVMQRDEREGEWLTGREERQKEEEIGSERASKEIGWMGKAVTSS